MVFVSWVSAIREKRFQISELSDWTKWPSELAHMLHG